MAKKYESPAGKQGQSSEHDKDSNFQNQYQKAYDAYYERPKTRLEVAVENNIYQGNVCRYTKSMLKNGTIQIIKHGRCPITGRKVEFLTSNPSLFPAGRPIQQTLFSHEH